MVSLLRLLKNQKLHRGKAALCKENTTKNTTKKQLYQVTSEKVEIGLKFAKTRGLAKTRISKNL